MSARQAWIHPENSVVFAYLSADYLAPFADRLCSSLRAVGGSYYGTSVATLEMKKGLA
jgi:hypothetical protein